MNMFLIVRSAAVSSIKTHHDVLKGESRPPRCHFLPKYTVAARPERNQETYIPYHLHCLSTFNSTQLNPSKGGPSERLHPWMLHCYTTRP